jgi:hypothetical protein
LLHALNRGSERTPRRSIGSTQVLRLCRTLFSDFTEEDFNAALALTNRRNEELHSGAAAFDEYRSSQWLVGFYGACRSLCTAMVESLVSLFGEDEATIATGILAETQKGVLHRVQTSIAAHRKVFQDKSSEERETAMKKAEDLGSQLAVQRHHRVKCPACQCVATLQGTPFGKENVTQSDGKIVVKQPVSPTSFSCSACGLKLQSYAEVAAADLGGHYMQTTTYSPEEYYGLIHPDDLESHVEEYLASMGEEYDTE